MSSVPRLSAAARLYVAVVCGLGFVAITHSFVRLYQAPVDSQWLVLAALTLISGSASVKLPGASVSISISEAFVFSAVLLYGPAAGTLTVAVDSLVISFWIARRRPERVRALFNISAPVVSAWLSAHLFFYASGIVPLVERSATLNQILPSLVLFAATYFGLNSWLIAIIVAIRNKENPAKIWRRGFVWLSLNYFCGASVAVLLVGTNRTVDLRFVGVLTPLLVVLYFTFRTAMQRVEDSNRHIDKLNTLYLSTIETLAMAIDAKDQITHGHIRRVQGYAIGLGRRLGITDDALIKAIEAAALLHDMGKLAVPEYILNKPGKLTAAEFDKMKLHASVGADILSAIDFPYPVVPIVRHHHENWDGTGYPDGLSGTDIPIGARILSVVDCFDALTSDRPYRPRLSDEAALRVITERRGSMYDPFVVDTFLAAHQVIKAETSGLAGDISEQALREITSSSSTSPSSSGSRRFDEIAASSDEMLTLFELARTLAGGASFRDVADVTTKHLRRLVPSSLFVFYSYDVSSDELEASYVVGDSMQVIEGLRVALGQRVSGWVAANRETITNADPVLDLGDIARSSTPRLCSCLSTPLISDDHLLGVLTLYSALPSIFTDNHKRIVETAARQAAHALRNASPVRRKTKQDSPNDLLSLAELERLVTARAKDNRTRNSIFELLFIEIQKLEEVKLLYGQMIGMDVLTEAKDQVQSTLRPGDLLFDGNAHGFVALLSGADVETAEQIAHEIRERSRTTRIMLPSGEFLPVDVTIRRASAPKNVQALREMITSLLSQEHGPDADQETRIH